MFFVWFYVILKSESKTRFETHAFLIQIKVYVRSGHRIFAQATFIQQWSSEAGPYPAHNQYQS